MRLLFTFKRQKWVFSMNGTKITFFMLVTDMDIVIADYAVRSYAKIKGIPFKLRVYSNWITPALKQEYFPQWRRFDFVDLVENEWQTEENRPSGPDLDGPCERYDTIWDRELRKIETPYHATVDADFEILDPKFIPIMLAELDADSNLIAMSTDYSRREPSYYDSYSKETICLNERWNTWFCIYKRVALQCSVSHAYYEEIVPGPVPRNTWDSAGYFQKALKDVYGFQLAALDQRYQPCFIHYGAFSKNRYITKKNIFLYRRLEILQKRGLFGGVPIIWRMNSRVARLAKYLERVLFGGKTDRSTYLPGWGGLNSK
jgi:hypothetical protein